MRLLLLALLATLSLPSNAGLITEIGGGYKDFDTTSYLVNSECKKAVVTQPSWPQNHRARGEYSCGGDNPVFVGWPIAWEFKNGATRIGWFHQSQWFDTKGELHFDCLCASHTIRWGDLIKRRRARRTR